MTIISDSKEREAAIDVTQSFIIQAPAGSGKTELLTQRFLALLTIVKDNPEEILAITFTNKAVNEMRHRIISALERGAVNTTPLEPHQQKTRELAQRVLQRDAEKGWNLLQNPHRLRIQTIDALCSRITLQLPLLSQFGGSPTIVDDATSYYKKAIDALWAGMDDDSAWSVALRKLLLHLDNRASFLQNLLIDLLKCRDQWLYYLYQHPAFHDKRQVLEKSLEYIITDCLHQLTICFPPHLADDLIEILAFITNQEHTIAPANAKLLDCLHCRKLPAGTLDNLAAWVGIATLLFTKENTWRKTVDKNLGFPSDVKNKEEKKRVKHYKEKFSTLINNLTANEQLYQSFIELRQLPPQCYSDKQWEILRELITLLPVLAAQLRLVFTQFSVIDYVENSQGALLALGEKDNPTDVALQLDYRLQHILVDEFQDTSINQYRLLEKLVTGWERGDGRTLFIVGDPMQSIYRFRKAEVGLFLRAQTEGIGNVSLIPLTLRINFRSTPTVVGWVNHTFGQAFPDFNNIHYGAMRYHAAEAIETIATESSVTLHAFDQNAQVAEAQRIVDIIQPIDNKSQVAILLRSKGHLSAIIPFLQKNNIAYRAIDIEPLSHRSVIVDLTALTKAMVNSGDKISWMSILRAPWCGLTLHDMYLIANSPFPTIIKTISTTTFVQSLSHDGQHRLNAVASILVPAYENRGKHSLAHYIETVWTNLQGPACCLHARDLEDVYRYFELLSTLDEGCDIANFSLLENKVNRLFATAKNGGKDAIQIMTMHKAKGLEFDTVILPSLHAQTRPNEKQLLTWMERPRDHQASDLLLAPLRAFGGELDGIYRYIESQDSIKNYYENIRLLYVACTRAKRHLHLLAKIKKPADKTTPLKPDARSLLSTVWESLHSEFLTKLTPENSIDLPTTFTTQNLILKRLPLSKMHISQSQPAKESANRNKINLQIIPHDSIETVYQQLLAFIAAYGIAWWKNHPAKEDFILQLLQKSDHFLPEAKAALVIILQAIHNTLNDPKGHWILAHQNQVKTERTIMTNQHGKIDVLTMDCRFVAENNFWIIDFKIVVDKSIEDISLQIAQYSQQLKMHAKAAESLAQAPVKLGLYFPVQTFWHEVT